MSQSAKQQQQQPQDDALTEARELFLEADFDQAMAKFKEAAAAAGKAGGDGGWSDALAAETGQAEVRIQQKDWSGAADQLTAAIAAVPAGDDKADENRARDLTRARYMLGVALLGQKKATDAVESLEAARRLAEAAAPRSPDCGVMLADIRERLAQLAAADDPAEAIDEDDLMEIAMEFGVTAEEDEDEEEEEEEDTEEDEEDYDDEEVVDDDGEDEEAAVAAAAASRKRRAVVASRANGGAHASDEDEEDDDDDDDEDFDEDDEDEEAGGGAPVASKRARISRAGGGASRNGGKAGANDDDEEEDEEEDEEVSSSA